jgi:hypothetical protein
MSRTSNVPTPITYVGGCFGVTPVLPGRRTLGSPGPEDDDRDDRVSQEEDGQAHLEALCAYGSMTAHGTHADQRVHCPEAGVAVGVSVGASVGVGVG